MNLPRDRWVKGRSYFHEGREYQSFGDRETGLIYTLEYVHDPPPPLDVYKMIPALKRLPEMPER